MNENKSNIIPFPQKQTPEKWTQETFDLETTHYLMNIVVEELADLGYDIDNDVLKKDIGVLANLMYASFQRNHANTEHIFHFVLDECDHMIQEVKSYMRNLEDNELDNEEPTNDNSRL